jgi:predicted MFS family arabinose efflux permease
MQSDWMHKWMVIVAVFVLVISLVLHQLSPSDELYVLVATTALGFLFGKATNGIGKRRSEDGDQS